MEEREEEKWEAKISDEKRWERSGRKEERRIWREEEKVGEAGGILTRGGQEMQPDLNALT